MRQMSITPVSSPLRAAFAISRGSKSVAETIVVELIEDMHRGRGECVPYARYDESAASVIAQIEDLRTALEGGLSREDLQDLLPAGAARCAVDCALWDLHAKQTGEPVWTLAGLPEPKPLPTTMTISLNTADRMAEAARATPATILKLKLGGPDDIDRKSVV